MARKKSKRDTSNAETIAIETHNRSANSVGRLPQEEENPQPGVVFEDQDVDWNTLTNGATNGTHVEELATSEEPAAPALSDEAKEKKAKFEEYRKRTKKPRPKKEEVEQVVVQTPPDLAPTPTTKKKRKKAKAQKEEPPAEDSAEVSDAPSSATKPAAGPVQVKTVVPRSPNSLTGNELRVLQLLAKQDRLTRKQMTTRTGIKKGWSKLLGASSKADGGASGERSLEARGLIQCIKDEGDRNFQYSITQKGLEVLAAQGVSVPVPTVIVEVPPAPTPEPPTVEEPTEPPTVEEPAVPAPKKKSPKPRKKTPAKEADAAT